MGSNQALTSVVLALAVLVLAFRLITGPHLDVLAEGSLEVTAVSLNGQKVCLKDDEGTYCGIVDPETVRTPVQVGQHVQAQIVRTEWSGGAAQIVRFT